MGVTQWVLGIIDDMTGYDISDKLSNALRKAQTLQYKMGPKARQEEQS